MKHALNSCIAVCFTPLGDCGKKILLRQIYLSSVVNIKPIIMSDEDRKKSESIDRKISASTS